MASDGTFDGYAWCETVGWIHFKNAAPAYNVKRSFVAAAPTITSLLAVAWIKDSAFSYQITATGTAPITFGALGLPPGLSLNGDTISGTLTTEGVLSIVLTASNGGGSDVRILVLVITESGAAASASDFQVWKTSLKFNLARTDTDQLSLTGSFAVPAGSKPDGKVFTLAIGNYTRSLPLNSKGRASDGQSSVRFSTVKKGAFKYSVASFAFTARKQTLFEPLKGLGFTGSEAPGALLQIPVSGGLDGAGQSTTIRLTHVRGQAWLGRK
jgi:hypothetical protein